MIETKRIDNLEFRKATYLGDEPKNPSYSIDMWCANQYYGHDNEYPEHQLDNSYRTDPKYPFHRIHKSCFKHPEYCFTIASFNYDSHENFYELHFCGDRPIEYLNTPEKREIFWELVKYGDSKLNNYNNEED